MTPRKELFITIKTALMTIPQLELVDFFRNQFGSGTENYPECWTAALIRVGTIDYETMTEQKQEGTLSIDIILYCRDGWMDQHNTTADPEHGFMEIDLQDAIAEKLQFLHGDQFKPLQQSSDDTEEATAEGVMSFVATFTTRIYRRLAPKYTNTKLTLNP